MEDSKIKQKDNPPAGGKTNGIESRQTDEYDQKVLDIARVTRVTKGGKRFTFRTAIVIGNRNGKVGFGICKGPDVARSVEKAFKQAKKYLITVTFKGGTIPHEIKAKVNSAYVFLKPSSKGSGVRAGGAMRVIAKLAGIEDVSGKIISKTNNKINIARATIEALKQLKFQAPNPKSQTNSNDQNSELKTV